MVRAPVTCPVGTMRVLVTSDVAAPGALSIRVAAADENPNHGRSGQAAAAEAG